MFEQNIEVGRFERQTHTEHNNAQQPRNIRPRPFEGVGREKSGGGKERGSEGKCFSDKAADFTEDIHNNCVACLFLSEGKHTRLNLNLQNDRA
ncbi:hypothetical protein IBX75_01455 [Neisseria gonorrhoeae]|nr:hypothetical protein IBX75_01455 [Neisseria gonorrhoeae]